MYGDYIIEYCKRVGLHRSQDTMPRKGVQRILQNVGEPPSELAENQVIGSVVKPRGNSQYEIKISDGTSSKLGVPNTIVGIMPKKFRNTVYVKRGGYLLVDLYDDLVKDGTDKLHGEISNIVLDRKEWQRYPYWPSEFEVRPEIDLPDSDSEDEEQFSESEEVDIAEDNILSTD